MADSYKTSAGATLFIGDSSSPPSYTKISGITNMGEFGRQYNQGTFTPVGSRGTEKYKGSFDEGNPTFDLARDLSDQGQTDLQTALDKDEYQPFKIELDDAPSGSGTSPTTYEFRAKVMSLTTNIGGADDYVSGQVTLAIEPDSVTETAAA